MVQFPPNVGIGGGGASEPAFFMNGLHMSMSARWAAQALCGNAFSLVSATVYSGIASSHPWRGASYRLGDKGSAVPGIASIPQNLGINSRYLRVFYGSTPLNVTSGQNRRLEIPYLSVTDEYLDAFNAIELEAYDANSPGFIVAADDTTYLFGFNLTFLY